MSNNMSTPVFCRCCENYAVAELAGTPMCWNCLYSKVCATGTNAVEIVPLDTSSISHASKSAATCTSLQMGQ